MVFEKKMSVKDLIEQMRQELQRDKSAPVKKGAKVKSAKKAIKKKPAKKKAKKAVKKKKKI